MSVVVRWYFFSYGSRTGAGRAAEGRGGMRDGEESGVPGAATGEAWRLCAAAVA